MPGVIRRNYVAVTVTAAAASTAYRLYDLILAALSLTETNSYVPMANSTLLIENDSANAGAPVLYVGDAAVDDSPQRCGYKLVAGAVRNYQTNKQIVPLGDIYVLFSAGTNNLINVEIMVP